MGNTRSFRTDRASATGLRAGWLASGGKSEALTVLSDAVFQAEKRLRAEAQTAKDTNSSERARLRKGIALLEGGAAEDYPGQLSESRDLLKKVEVREACRFIRHDVSPQKIGVLSCSTPSICSWSSSGGFL